MSKFTEEAASNPRADLEALLRRVLNSPLPAWEPRELCCSGRQLIEMYRHGVLRPGDDTLRILIPAADRPMVEEFLRTFTPEA